MSLRAENVVAAYGGAPVLHGVTLALAPGEKVALLGPNGAGKSTLLKALGGLLPLVSGRVTNENPLGAGENAAWVPQEVDALYSLTVGEFVALGLYPRSRWWGWRPPADGAERVRKTLQQLGLLEMENRFLSSLSGGERRRACLARGLAQGARVLLLDEPTTHLDPRHQAALLALLRDLAADGIAVMAALHDLSAAFSWADRVILLENGRPAGEGRPEDVLTEERLTRVYGARAEIIRDKNGCPAAVRFL